MRDLERLGVLPAAERGANGYRRYRMPHVLALHAYRALATALGPVPARRLMPAHRRIGRAGGGADRHPARGSRPRTLTGARGPARTRGRGGGGRRPVRRGRCHAQALGVRSSALRHWEQKGSCAPFGVQIGPLLRLAGITEARIAAALRSGGYGIPAVSRIIDEVRAHGDTQVQGSSLTSAPGSAPGPRGSADSRRGGR
ncbi:hypothetical protein JM654_18340 [Microbacterium oxydans]|nr:hypothetical protein [Microbacterium oxydans]